MLKICCKQCNLMEIYQIYQSENIVHLHLQLTKILPNVPQMARKHIPDLKCILLIPKIKQCLD